MKIKSSTISLCQRILYESISADMMVRFVRLLDPEYDLHARSGIPENYPITNQMAATRIVQDIIDDGRFIDFIETLVRIDADGYMGRPYPIKGLNQIVKTLSLDGFLFDRATRQFFENAKERASPDWGRLRDGDERQAAVLRLDLVGSSAMVNRNSAEHIERAYADFRTIVQRSVHARYGRLWLWEGDGAFAAFVFGQKERSAVLAGMEILNELFFYNKLDNPLAEPVHVRIAVHAGPIVYRDQPMELLKNETIREVVQIEFRSTPTDTLSASANLFLSIDRVIQERFDPERQTGGDKIRHYAINLEKP